jgi:hypothetical protein
MARTMIGLRLDPTSVSIPAGGTGSIEAIVINDGTTVDEIAFDVVGAAAAWSTVTPTTVRLFPGDRATVEVRFKPVSGPQLASGRHDFGVRARSTTDSSSSAVAEASVVVGAAPMMSASLEPRLARGRGRARQRLHIANVGNSPAIVSISASDPDDQLHIRHDQRPFDLAPGAARQIKVVSTPMSRLGGRGAPLPMQITVTPEGGTPTVLDGRVAFESLIPGWASKAAAVVGAAAVLLAAFLVFRKPTTLESSAVNATETTSASTLSSTQTTAVASGDSTPTTVGPGETSAGTATPTTSTKAPATTNAPDNSVPGNQVESNGLQPWAVAAGGTDGSVWIVRADGTKATTVVPGGSGLDPAPAWSLDRSQIVYVRPQGSSTEIAFASVVAQGGGPGSAVPLLPCQTCDPGDPPDTTPPRTVFTVPPTTPTTTTTTPTKVTTASTTSSATTTTTLGGTTGTTAAPQGTTIQHPLFIGSDTVVWDEQSCTGRQCVTSIVFADTTLKEKSRARIAGVVTMMAADPTDQEVLAVANDRLLVVRPGVGATDDGGPFTGVSVDHRGHTIGWHSDRPGTGAVLEDVQDHHTINTGKAGAVTALTWSPDGVQVSYVTNGRLFVANADFSGARDVTPTGITVASVA